MIDHHYCKHCGRWFRVSLGRDVTGDLILECPHCMWHHYRRFERGEAVHCDVNRAHDTPKLIKGV